MSKQIKILPAVEDDIPRILQFIRGLAAYEHLSDQCVATEEKLRRDLFGEHRFAEVLMGSLDGTQVGFALFFYNYSTFLARPGIYLEDIFVLPEHRCRGVGKALLKRVAEIARDRQCGRLEWTVLDWNQPSIEFYQRIGARVLPDWRVCRMTENEIAKFADT